MGGVVAGGKLIQVNRGGNPGSELINELGRIGFGHDTTASPRDRVLALNEFLRRDYVSREVTTVHMHICQDSDR
jgi:hypothetical protein